MVSLTENMFKAEDAIRHYRKRIQGRFREVRWGMKITGLPLVPRLWYCAHAPESRLEGREQRAARAAGSRKGAEAQPASTGSSSVCKQPLHGGGIVLQGWCHARWPSKGPLIPPHVNGLIHSETSWRAIPGEVSHYRSRWRSNVAWLRWVELIRPLLAAVQSMTITF